MNRGERRALKMYAAFAVTVLLALVVLTTLGVL